MEIKELIKLCENNRGLDYSKLYDELIINAKCQNRTRKKGTNQGSLENHHIKPKCFGGDDSGDNMALLTCSEHYIAHYLLACIYGTGQLWTAFYFMNNQCSEYQKRRASLNSSILYEKSKEKAIQFISKCNKGKIISEYQRKRISELNKKKKWWNNGEISVFKEICPEGFIHGRLMVPSYSFTHSYLTRVISEETKNKISEAAKKTWQDPEVREKRGRGFKEHRFSTKGLHYFNNGIDTILAKNCPEGFVKGSLNKPCLGKFRFNNGVIEVITDKCPEGFVKGSLSKSTKGYHWYNNGVIQTSCLECPEGFVPGQLKNKKEKNFGI